FAHPTVHRVNDAHWRQPIMPQQTAERRPTVSCSHSTAFFFGRVSARSIFVIVGTLGLWRPCSMRLRVSGRMPARRGTSEGPHAEGGSCSTTQIAFLAQLPQLGD